MKKATKSPTKSKKKNVITIVRRTGEVVKSTNPPAETEAAVIHKPVDPDDIHVVNDDVADTFKTADKITDCDKLEFENGKLRSRLVIWHDFLELDGKLYKLQVDPLAKKIRVVDE